MSRNKLILHIYFTYIVFITALTATFMWFASDFIEKFFHDQSMAHLSDRGYMISDMLNELPLPLTKAVVDPLCKKIGLPSNAVVIISLPDGNIIGDSKNTDTAYDPIFEKIKLDVLHKGNADGLTTTLPVSNRKILHVFIPYRANGKLEAVIRVSSIIPSIEDEVAAVKNIIFLFGVAAAVFAFLPAFWLYFRLSAPLHEMVRGIGHFSEGDLTYRIPVSESVYMTATTKALNQMAVQLDTKLKTVIYQKDKLETVLTNMLEGVLAVDNNEKALIFNHAVIDMFNIRTSYIIGRSVQELIRHISFLDFATRATASEEAMEGTLVLYQKSERILQVHSTPLLDAKEKHIGTLFVFNDITKVKRLEKMRSEFVANVSHEIKTPLTAIKGFVETLLEADHKSDPEETHKFLQIIHKHVKRLEAIIRDLLNLSGIEKGNEESTVDFKKTNVRKVVENAVTSCLSKLDDNKEADVKLVGENEVYGRINASLLEQALLNLLDNAVKYSSKKSEIEVKVESDESGIQISVKDNGIGIPQKHQNRIFERFYRVDKSRSRKLGGTGLGLAIVKHIVQAHNGAITLESYPNIGSTFTITLPHFTPEFKYTGRVYLDTKEES